MMQEAQIALRAAEQLARRDRWPAGLLPAVQLALADADPIGPDWLRGQGARWEAVAEALMAVAEDRPADASYLSRLLEVATGGASIADSPVDLAAGAASDFARGVAQDVRAAAGAAAEMPGALQTGASGARWLALAAIVLGGAWYVSRARR